MRAVTATRRPPRALRRKRRSGAQSLVEFSLAAPIVLVLIIGAAQLGAILYANITVATAARDGARVAATQPINSKAFLPVPPASPYPTGSSYHCASGDTTPACQAVTSSQGLLSNLDTTVSGTAVPGPYSYGGYSCPSNAVQDGTVTVTVTSQVPIFVPILNQVFAQGGGNQRAISTTVTMRVEPCGMTQGS